MASDDPAAIRQRAEALAQAAQRLAVAAQEPSAAGPRPGAGTGGDTDEQVVDAEFEDATDAGRRAH